MQKISGAYYTPSDLADFVVAKSVSGFDSKKGVSVLEPSSGDGAFVKAFGRRHDHARFTIKAIELCQEAIEQAKAEPSESRNVTYTQSDFLFFKTKTRYDLIIGNPPFIKAKLLKKEQFEQCQEIHKNAGLGDKAVKNIWTSFLVKSVSHLSDKGVLAFVLPAELLQVKFAQEIQEFLKKRFSRIEIYTFKKILFKNIGQDTVALVANNDDRLQKGVYFAEIADISQLPKSGVHLTQSNVAEGSDIKWSAHIIPEKEIEFLLKICAKLKPVSDYCSAGAGIVTGANQFFIVTKKIRDQYKLSAISRPIIQRGQFVYGDIVFDAVRFKEIIKREKPAFLLDFSKRKVADFSIGEREYLASGETIKIPERFKCRIRTRWFDVPSIWHSEAFFFKRCHLYPKLLKNDARILVTDSAYRIKMKPGYSVDSFIFSFYNSLTLALAELKGRFYGGGVLELTPNEFKSVPLPYIEIASERFRTLRKAFDKQADIEGILKQSDNEILRNGLNLSVEDVKRIQVIRQTLLHRRLRRSGPD